MAHASTARRKYSKLPKTCSFRAFTCASPPVYSEFNILAGARRCWQSSRPRARPSGDPGMQSNRKIFWASFLTLIAAGMGFAIRGDVLSEWEREFGFTKTELGTITGGGLVGMAFTIIGFSLFADRVGYKLLLIGAFLLHVLSAIVTLAATF